MNWVQFASVLGSVISTTLAGIALVGFLDSRKKLLMDKGAKEAELKTLREDVRVAHEKIRYLESCSQTSEVNTAETRKDILYIRESQSKLERTLETFMAEIRSALYEKRSEG